MRVSSSERAAPASKSGSSQSDGWSRHRGDAENADHASSSSPSGGAASGSASPRMAGTSPVPGSVQCGSSTPRPGVTIGDSGSDGGSATSSPGPQWSSSAGGSGSGSQLSSEAVQPPGSGVHASGSSGGIVLRPSRY